MSSASDFTEHTNADGRTYWYNKLDKSSVWEKPDALKTPFERAMMETSWKEYTNQGRKYWVHKETKESSWSMPTELIELEAKVAKENPAPKTQDSPATTAAVAGGPASPAQAAASVASPSAQNALVVPGGAPIHIPRASPTPAAATPTPAFIPTPVIPAAPARPVDRYVIPEGGWRTLEEAEEAFAYLLKKNNVDMNATWDQTMRAVITDPLYKSLHTLAEKKAVFTKYIADAKARHKEEKEARLLRLRPQYRKLLADHPQVYSYSTFRTAESLFAGSSIWKAAKDQDERRTLFEEFVAELKQKEAIEARELRSQNVAKLAALMKDIGLTVSARWRDVHHAIMDSREWREDPPLQSIEPLEILNLFEEHVKELEKEHEARMRRLKIDRVRAARKAREGFKSLLQELIAQKKITYRSKWKRSLPLFATDERYLALLGKPGSTPLELWMDAIDDLEHDLEVRASKIRDIYARANVPPVTLETTLEEFADVLAKSTDGEWKPSSEEEVKELYDFIQERLAAKKAEEERRADRKRRHAIEDFRYAMKKVEPPLDLDATYEDSVSRLSQIKEYADVPDEEDRRQAFQKFVKRQKEKLREQAEGDARGGGGGGSSFSRSHGSNYGNSSSHHKDDVVMDYGGNDRDRERDRDRGGRWTEDDRSRRRGSDRREEDEPDKKRAKIGDGSGEREEGEI